MGCGISFVKYTLFIFNFVFTLAGLAMLAVGILMKLRLQTVSRFLDDKFSAPPVLLIVVGALVFVVAFYGCCGAVRESSCMVTTFSVLLMTLLLVGIAVATVALVFRDKVEDILTAEFQSAVHNYTHNSAAVDAIQENLHCCGSVGPADYATLPAVPRSCCVTQGAANCSDLHDEKQVFQAGCVQQMKSFIKDFGTIIGALAAAVSGIMVVGIISGFCLASSFRRKARGFALANMFSRNAGEQLLELECSGLNVGPPCIVTIMEKEEEVALAGLALLIVGALMQAKVGAVSHYLEGKFSAPPIFMIVIGSIVFVVAFYGCCGAIRESSCMVTTFSIFLMVILVAEITVAVLAFVYRNEYQSVFTTEFARNVADYGTGNKTNDGTVDAIQATLECCGAQGPQDYNGRTLPRSCCVAPEHICTDATNGAHVFLTGCEEALKNFINNLGLLIGCLAIGVAFIMVMGIIFGLCLASSIRNEIRRGYA
ncbi:uncharacterized protein LOC134533387 [Bacillus rossius redtenbacheri]|uniref:uncharacterized protein LOC134533387 n=1 Tax=Bacillus rossius redtenbacheri TaxID=93214 RepID=UPI002FDD5B79